MLGNLWKAVLGLAMLAPAMAFAQQKKGTNYAFLVGCSGYDKNELKPLPYTMNDVEEFRKALLAGGYEDENIKTLHDKQNERRYLPEKAKITKEFQLLLRGLKPEDSVLVALSGHGIHFKGDPTGYFCPLDAKLNDKNTLIAMDGSDGVFDQLKACKARRKLLLVNACRNDPASDLAQASRRLNIDDVETDVVPEGIAALYSCQQGEKSYYDPDRKMGLFFFHLCKAWRGEYLKENGPITIEHVFGQVTVKTKGDADKTFGQSQIPVVKRDYQGEWVIGTVNRAVASRDTEPKPMPPMPPMVEVKKKWYEHEIFPLTIGSTWRFKTSYGPDLYQRITGHETVGMTPGAVLVSYVNGVQGGSEHLTVSPSGVFRLAFNNATPDVPIKVLALPFKEGATWNVNSRGGNDIIRMKSVSTEEEITVPAGKFKAITVRSTGTISDTDTELTVWIVRGIGIVKTVMTVAGNTNTIELKEYKIEK